MSFSPVPRYSFRNVTDIAPDFLKERGIKFLMVDLDNTLAAYGQTKLTDAVSKWADHMKNSGIELYIISNTLKKERVASFAQQLVVESISGAGKPSPKGILSAMNAMGYEAGESALAGDQILTDTLAANSAGVLSILLRPIRCQNPFLAIRYMLEAPFRLACKNRM
ncbi:MAG: YqeG family HAD IIIA-type phosphatase [Oscillospiraceae bacterium]|nr:YqeG family HAD IIIA-type phosphatase [Oscillospiraceae bacterium]